MRNKQLSVIYNKINNKRTTLSYVVLFYYKGVDIHDISK